MGASRCGRYGGSDIRRVSILAFRGLVEPYLVYSHDALFCVFKRTTKALYTSGTWVRVSPSTSAFVCLACRLRLPLSVWHAVCVCLCLSGMPSASSNSFLCNSRDLFRCKISDIRSKPENEETVLIKARLIAYFDETVLNVYVSRASVRRSRFFVFTCF